MSISGCHRDNDNPNTNPNHNSKPNPNVACRTATDKPMHPLIY